MISARARSAGQSANTSRGAGVFNWPVEPIGPVRARVAQIGGKTSVTLVADQPASAASLQQDLGALKAALAQANLEPGDLHCLGRDQTRVTAPEGQFVNRAS